MKRKTPVQLCLLSTQDESCSFFNPIVPPVKRAKRQMKPMVTIVDVPSRVCTPSPPMSPVVARKVKPQTKSIMRKGSRRTLKRYRNCKELVDPERDLSIGSDYHMLLFSHMIMEQGRDPCFRCRQCPQSESSTFYCKSISDFQATIPSVERHLMEDCQACPSWLQQGIVESKATHASQVCEQKPYSHLVWKRILAHAIYSRMNAKRVKFSSRLCQEHIIPARPIVQRYRERRDAMMRASLV